jgi:hypothetical protein
VRPAAYSGYARLTPPLAAAAALWVLAAVSLDLYVEAAVAAVALSAVSGMIDRASPLYAWLALPSLAVVSLTHGVEAGFETAGRILVAAMGASGALATVSPLEAYRWLRWAGLPWHWALLPALVARQAQVAWALAGEARASLSGRGLRGARLAARLPLPLLVHLYRGSSMLAETLYYRGAPGRAAERPPLRLTPLDGVVASYIALSTLSAALSP